MSTKIDLSEFFKYSRPKKRPCPIGFADSQLVADDREKLQAAISQDNGIITTGAIVEWLKVRGHIASVPAVTAHRKGSCSCGA